MSWVLIGVFIRKSFSFYREIERLKKEKDFIRKQLAKEQTIHSVTKTIQVQGKFNKILYQ
jgi:hypothetical protein